MAKKPSRPKKPVSYFPLETLEDAIQVPKALQEGFGGQPTLGKTLGEYMGFHLPAVRFTSLLHSAFRYGLVSGAGLNTKVSLSETGRDIVLPSSQEQRQSALKSAFRTVDIFARVEDKFDAREIQDDEYFANQLVRDFSVPLDRVDKFSKVFHENLRFLRSFDVDATANLSIGIDSNDLAESIRHGEQIPRVRRFLDTCFVMMPFGEWFDVYYAEIYVPAIRAASLEPIRADEVFTTGSVVEQIWEEIVKSSVLLADLTGKNPNVFYELGLAHAAHKPVVFTSACLDDVPFDLRHLRVIIYDVRHPKWAERLQQHITDYLKNARELPDKSIPQPFRSQLTDRTVGKPWPMRTN